MCAPSAVSGNHQVVVVHSYSFSSEISQRWQFYENIVYFNHSIISKVEKSWLCYFLQSGLLSDPRLAILVLFFLPVNQG